MEQRPPQSRNRPVSAAVVVRVVGIGALGLLMVHHPMLLSGFRRIQTDPGDSRLNHYILEHGYRWVLRAQGHERFWDPPFFHPLPNASARSDLLVSTGPLYWPWRVLGAWPDLAFGLWMILASALNYAAAFLLLGRGLGLNPVPAAAGAFLVSFGAPRVNQLGHQQLLPCFYLLISTYCMARRYQRRDASPSVRWSYWMLAALGVVLQFYAGFYLAWLMGLVAGLAVVAGLFLPGSRCRMAEVARQDWTAMLAAAALATALLAPLVLHYLPVSRWVEAHRHVPTLRAFHPLFSSWIFMGERSWLWGWTARRWPFTDLVVPHEHRLGIGVITPLACAAGLVAGRSRQVCRLASWTILAAWFLTSYWPGTLFAALAAVVCIYCAACLYREGDQPSLRAAALAALVVVLWLRRFPSPPLRALGLVALVFCVLEVARGRSGRAGRSGAGAALVLICLKLFDLEVLATGVLVVSPFLVPAYLLGLRGWKRLGLSWLGLLLLFASVETDLRNPGALAAQLLGTPLAILATARWPRPSARLCFPVFLLALPLAAFFYLQDTLWLALGGYLPGSSGVRAVGRIVLILLIPAALGLATLIQHLESGRRAAWARLLILTSVLEQGVTTESYDAAANRSAIRDLARQVRPGCDAFYYRPAHPADSYRYHLDAMWASMRTGVPTINGYSGYPPRGWEAFQLVDFSDRLDPDAVLAQWIRRNGLRPDRIQRIPAPERIPAPG